jgi:hypothetical protein
MSLYCFPIKKLGKCHFGSLFVLNLFLFKYRTCHCRWAPHKLKKHPFFLSTKLDLLLGGVVVFALPNDRSKKDTEMWENGYRFNISFQHSSRRAIYWRYINQFYILMYDSFVTNFSKLHHFSFLCVISIVFFKTIFKFS